MLTTRVLTAQVPVTIEVPDQMHAAIVEVLSGEYEPGYFGEGLSILDIGANVGSFSLWANLRWPRSTLYAYEPHPGTCAMLRRNVAAFDNIKVFNVAVYSGEQQQAYYARFEGDGEGGLTEYMERTFRELAPALTFSVDVLHPNRLPRAHIVKVDVEGAEAEILRGLDLSTTELVLLEYQDEANQQAIKQLLADRFELVLEDALPWDELLGQECYRPDLAGNHYGRMFFASRARGRLRRLTAPRTLKTTAAQPPSPAPPAPPPPAPPPAAPLRHQLVDKLNAAIKGVPLVHGFLKAAAARRR